MRLTFEQTRGTRTIYYPLDKSSEQPPEFTVMIRPALDAWEFAADADFEDRFEAGVAFCNPNDMFVKRQGRAIAFERLNSVHKIAGSAEKIRAEIFEKALDINASRPACPRKPLWDLWNMDTGQIEEDLAFSLTYKILCEYFTKKDENRKEQNAQVA